ncbi:AAA family ATPase [Clostridium gasigenes]|nr:AAA family ATPase [Clostridium gasigenes]QSW18612.1 AAA family ATPase [Clostridium gasigenes]
MIIMINGAFGVGKTSVGKKLIDKIPNSMIYDPEEVGFMLKNIIIDNVKKDKELTDDFQDLEIWRKLVVEIGGELILKYKKNLIVPMTIRKKEYLNYIYNGFKALDGQVYHYCLTASLDEVYKRLLNRGDNIGSWPYKQGESCVELFKESFFKHHINTENKSIDEVVEIILQKTSQFTDKYFLDEFLGERTYTIKADNLDLTALNSAHQRIKNIVRKKPCCEVIIKINPLIIQQQLDIGDLNKYLQYTKYIQSDHVEVNKLIKKIIKDEKQENIIVKKALNFTRNIKNNEDLLKRIHNGETFGESVTETIRKGTGTCFECTNVFIAIMRNIGIPCKFILGKISAENYHSWAEVFIEEQGWIPVETQNYTNDDIENWYLGITNKHVKIFEGLDYDDINIRINDMQIEIKSIGQI